MGRRTSEDWIKEQSKDNISSMPITLDLIESNVHITSLNDMLILEGGRSDYRKCSDIDLCREIDSIVNNERLGSSIYTLSYGEKKELAERMRHKYHVGEAQLCRCLAMNYMPER